MNSLSCSLGLVVGYLLNIYWLLMLVYALVSWVPSLQGRWTNYVARIVEPVLIPVRRVIPPIGGLDVAFLVVLLLVGYLMRSIPRAACPLY